MSETYTTEQARSDLFTVTSTAVIAATVATPLTVYAAVAALGWGHLWAGALAAWSVVLALGAIAVSIRRRVVRAADERVDFARAAGLHPDSPVVRAFTTDKGER